MASFLQGGPVRRGPRPSGPMQRADGRIPANPAGNSRGGAPFGQPDQPHDGHSRVQDALQQVVDTRTVNGFTRDRNAGLPDLDTGAPDADDSHRYNNYNPNEL